jgi:hypothetical protein
MHLRRQQEYSERAGATRHVPPAPSWKDASRRIGRSRGASMVGAAAMAVYRDTPSGEARRRNEAGTSFVMGGGSYSRIREALTQQLAELDAQKDIAFGVDIGAA